MALGCMLIVGWLFGRAADFFLGLPPLLGYMAFGFVFTNTQGPNLQAARSYLLKLAFIVVLVRAGLEISPRDLTKLTVALSVLPFAADALVTGFIASSIYGLSGLEAATYSSIMCSVGEGIIIPRMVDMIRKSSPGHTLLPRAVLTAAPVECILSLFMFGACSSMLSGLPKEGADTSGYAPLSGGQQAGLLLLQITVTLSMATALAHSFALLLGARKRIVWRSGKRFFIGSAHEELIVVIAMAMISYGTPGTATPPAHPAAVQPRSTRAGQGRQLGRSELTRISRCSLPACALRPHSPPTPARARSAQACRTSAPCPTSCCRGGRPAARARVCSPRRLPRAAVATLRAWSRPTCAS